MSAEDAAATPHNRDARTVAGPAAQSPLDRASAGAMQGVQVGPFEVKALLGAGGFGSVYLAEQVEPVQRLAALKMLNGDRQGRRFRELFEAERRVLARLDHANIARVLDAGTTKDGRDWVAMEYAPGLPIDRYCDQNSLTIPERMDLLAEVARAVDFAHHKGVVHRDLKPSNILVHVDGGTVVPKIIDFGIARVLSMEAQASEPDRVVGTPGFMAPEQTVAGGFDADARADVYALGAIMYLLCTGTLPLQPPSAGQPLEEFAQRLRTVSPPLMSQRVREMAPDAAQAQADLRRTTPRDLRHQLEGDLDWIAARALDRGRLRRYADAGDMADDLRRWRAQRPVDAAPRTIWYRASKFRARNSVAVWLAVVLGLALAGALVASALGWRSALRAQRTAESEEARANEEAAEARSAARFISEMLSAANVDRAPAGSATTVLSLLAGAAQAADTTLNDRPATDAAVRLALGQTYTTLGLLDKAAVQLLRAGELTEAVYGRDSGEMVDVLEARAELALRLGAVEMSRALLQEAYRTLEEQPEVHANEMARNRTQMAVTELESGRPQEALAYLQAAQTSAMEHQPPNKQILSTIDWYRSLAYLDLGQYQPALEAIDRNLSHNMQHLPADHWWVAESRTARAAALAGLGKQDEAWELTQQSLPAMERALRPGALVLRKAFARAAFVADKSGHATEASAFRAKALQTDTAPVDVPVGTPGAHPPAPTTKASS
ncbi:MAG: serine/threonine-protein kinase [Phycisphaerales bacterium]